MYQRIVWFLFIWHISTPLLAQEKGSFWLNMQMHSYNRVEHHPQNLIEYNRQQQQYNLGWFVGNRIAFGSNIMYYKGQAVEYYRQAILDGATPVTHWSATLDTDVYTRFYFVKKGGLLALELGLNYRSERVNLSPQHNFDNNLAIIDEISSNRRQKDYKVVYNVLTGVQVSPQFTFLARFETEWSTEFVPQKVGLHLGAEYYFNLKKQSKELNYWLPLEQKRQYLAVNIRGFRAGEGLEKRAHFVYSFQVENGFSTQIWMDWSDETASYPISQLKGAGGLLQKTKAFKNSANIFYTFGCSGAWENNGVHKNNFRNRIYGEVEQWHARRLRLLVGSSFSNLMLNTNFELQYQREWNAHGAVEFFITPNFSWRGQIEVPIIQSNWSKNAELAFAQNNTTQVAARIWF